MSSSGEFLPIENMGSVYLWLKEGAENLSEARIWTKNHEIVVRSHIAKIEHGTRNLHFTTPLGFSPKMLNDVLNRQKAKICYLSVQLPKATLYFKAPPLEMNDSEVIFTFPKLAFQLQRRQHQRWTIPESRRVKVTLEDPLDSSMCAEGRVIDLSAGGMAVFLKIESGITLKSKQILKNFSFKISERNFHCPVEVRHVGTFDHRVWGTGCRVGLKFKDLPKVDEVWIDDLVDEQNRFRFSGMV